MPDRWRLYRVGGREDRRDAVREGRRRRAHRLPGRGRRTGRHGLRMGWLSNVEAMWEEPDFARFLDRLATFSRLILFDKRGIGLSDRVTTTAADPRDPHGRRAGGDGRRGSERAVVFGVSEGGPMSMLFAATYPERTVALVLYGTAADFTTQVARPYKDDEAALPRAHGTRLGHDGVCARRDRGVGRTRVRGDDRLISWLASYMRRSASPSCRGRARADESRDQRDPRAGVDPRADARDREDRDLDFPIEEIRRDGRAHRRAPRSSSWRATCTSRGSVPQDDDPRRGRAVRRAARRDGGRARPRARHRAVHRHRGLDRDRPPSWATEPGRSSSRRTIAACGASSPGSAASRSTRRATASSRPSTARLARFAARRRSSTPIAPLGIEIRAGVHTGEVETIDGKVGGWPS